jgi:transmembrane protein EpsG
MLPYFILLFFVIIFALLSQKYRKNSKLSSFFSFPIFIILVLFAGLRDSNVGTDTNNYVGSFITSNLEESVLKIKTYREIGYLILERFAKNITNEYWFLLTLIALISLYFYYKIILKLSYNYTISFFVFISLGVYLFIFNGARQGMAAAIYSFAVLEMIKGNFKKYLFWVGIAFLFHKTVLITLPMYFLLRLKFSFKNLIIIIISSVSLILLSFQILSLLPESFAYRYIQYLDRGAQGGVSLTIFNTVTTIILLTLRRFISLKRRKYYDIYLNHPRQLQFYALCKFPPNL